MRNIWALQVADLRSRIVDDYILYRLISREFSRVNRDRVFVLGLTRSPSGVWCPQAPGHSRIHILGVPQVNLKGYPAIFYEDRHIPGALGCLAKLQRIV